MDARSDVGERPSAVLPFHLQQQPFEPLPFGKDQASRFGGRETRLFGRDSGGDEQGRAVARDVLPCVEPERVGGYCRECGNYGRSWGCPPFGFDVDEYLAGYASALLVATKIVPETRGIPISESGRLIRPERLRLEARLLEMERLYGGRSFAYVGTCLHCPEGSCTRPAGKPCRHPDKVRPSLEACGFDIARTTSELFGIDLKWGSEGRIPEYLTLVCGFFHNADSVIWNE